MTYADLIVMWGKGTAYYYWHLAISLDYLRVRHCNRPTLPTFVLIVITFSRRFFLSLLEKFLFTSSGMKTCWSLLPALSPLSLPSNSLPAVISGTSHSLPILFLITSILITKKESKVSLKYSQIYTFPKSANPFVAYVIVTSLHRTCIYGYSIRVEKYFPDKGRELFQ